MVVNRHTKVQFVLLFLGEFEGMRVGVLVSHEDQLSSRRIGCYG